MSRNGTFLKKLEKNNCPEPIKFSHGGGGSLCLLLTSKLTFEVVRCTAQEGEEQRKRRVLPSTVEPMLTVD